ncbi:ABC transporter permease [Sinomonas susongensis]|uniref:ABC transporter permease n=1 Tax=Sinomonas susongensis TaxID=1324851 RepID=UPI001486C050|nr:ABC transporter permease [Sinomonas susongensis]
MLQRLFGAGGGPLERTPNKAVLFGLRFTNLAVLLILLVFFALSAPGFLSLVSFSNILDSTSVFLLLALGETFVIFAGGIDLSVGSMLSLGGVASASYMSERFAAGDDGVLTTVVGILIACAVGLLGGVLNGVVIAYMKLDPLIVTLGTLGIFLGIADLISNGLPVGDLPPAAFTLGNGQFLHVPYVAIIALGFAAVLSFVARKTRFGRYCYAIGASQESVRRAGVNLNRHTIMLYGISGALAGLAGMLNAAHFSSASSSAGANALLVAIAAVVIGGTPISGGEGKIWGTVIGALIYTLLDNGFVLMGIASFWQLVVVGALIILAVYLDEYQRRLRLTVGISRDTEGVAPALAADGAAGQDSTGAKASA